MNRFLILIVTVIVGCGRQAELSGSENRLISSNAFFENSKREQISSNDEEAKGLARVGGCTGFFIQNKNQKNILVSARHCFNFKATDWCLNGGVATVEFDHSILRCRQVMAGDANHDIVVMVFEDSERDRSKDFVLANFPVEKNMRLAMYGFPADPYNPGRYLTLTENCWVHLPFSFSAYMGDRNNESNKNFTHNCSTYGGNSGGPMVLEGTRTAIGLPNVYFPDVFLNKPSNNSVEGISIHGFVEDFKATLNLFGVAFQDDKREKLKGFYQQGTFSSFTIPRCDIEVEAINYNTSNHPTYVRVRYHGEECGGMDEFQCDALGNCPSSTNDGGLKLISPDQFIYYWQEVSDGLTYYRI